MKVVFKNVLCTTDLSDFSNMSVYYGAALARVFEATLHLCHVIDLPIVSVHGEAFTYPPDYAQTLKEDALRQMDTLMNPLQLKWVPHVEIGAIAHTVSDLVGMTQADLVISASHGRSGLKRLLLGSVTEQLLRSIRIPFLVVTAPEKRDDDIAERRITRDTVENFGLKKNSGRLRFFSGFGQCGNLRLQPGSGLSVGTSPGACGGAFCLLRRPHARPHDSRSANRFGCSPDRKARIVGAGRSPQLVRCQNQLPGGQAS